MSWQRREVEMELFADYHTHTHHSHGRDSVEEHAHVARKKGLEEIGVADHGPASWWPVGLRGEAGWHRYRQDCRKTDQDTDDIRVLLGIEANVVSLKGDLDVPDAWRQELDMLLVGLHLEVWPKTWRDGSELVINNALGAKLSPRLRRRARNLNTKALVECVCRHDIDIITHPGLKLEIDTAELARTCAHRGTALEINSSHQYLQEEYITLAAKEGACFAISSDAHCARDVGANEKGVALARRAGLRPEQVINARGKRGGRGWRTD